MMVRPISFRPLLALVSVSLALPAFIGAGETEYIRVEPGEFVMGVGKTLYGPTRREVNNDHPYSVPIKGNEAWNEQPSHTVKITRPFELARTEVTVADFREFVEASGYVTDAEKNGTAIGFDPEVEGDLKSRQAHFDRFRMEEGYSWKNPGIPQEPDHPVVCVSWNDARAYAEWLSGQDAEHTYRLPTAAEWEYSCKAGTDTWYSCGNDPDKLYDYANVADAAYEQKHPNAVLFQRIVALEPGDGDGFPYTAPVASLKANPWGFHDLHGNVWEWVADTYVELHYQDRVQDAAEEQGVDEEEVVIEDPTGPELEGSGPADDLRVIRGGGWNVAPISCRSTMRAFGDAGDAFCYTGFRLVREAK